MIQLERDLNFYKKDKQLDIDFNCLMTIYGKLVAIQEDTRGYINYVFKIMSTEEATLIKSKYISCVRFPNWDCRKLQLGDIGYMVYELRKAGIDSWFDGTKLIPYKYNSTQFINFIESGESQTKSCIM